MTTASNALKESRFVYTSPKIKIRAYKTARTPKVITILSIPSDTSIAGWLLKSLLLVQLTPKRKESLATTWLERITEYGIGDNENDAITDLVTSLGEYKEALEEREENLGDSARRELDYLRKIIERSS